MNKAILVSMRDMPASCLTCYLRYEDKRNDIICVLTKYDVGYDEYITERHPKCPLKPIPERKRESSKIYDEELYNSGWNDCIDELLKGEE